MTEILKGDFDVSAMPKSGRVAQIAAAVPAPFKKLRLETPSIFHPPAEAGFASLFIVN
jgi:hypothetical protein